MTLLDRLVDLGIRLQDERNEGTYGDDYTHARNLHDGVEPRTFYMGYGLPAGTEAEAEAAGMLGPVIGGMENRPDWLKQGLPGPQAAQPAARARVAAKV